MSSREAAAADTLQETSTIVPVFVVGCYRSGTTLMENVLSRQGEFATLGFETHFFTHVLRGKPLPEFNRGHWREPLKREFGVDAWERAPGDRLDAYRRLMATRTREKGGRFWVEKTPDHVFAVDRIRRLLPGSKFIAMLRDGRDVVASIVHAPYILPKVTRRSDRLVAACAMWEWMTAETSRIAAQGKADVMLVRYEQLVQSPAEQLRRLSQFLGLSAGEPDLSLWLSRLDDIESNSSFGAFAGLDASPARRARTDKRLSGEEMALVERLTSDTLRAAGYDSGVGGRTPLPYRIRRRTWLLKRTLRTIATHGSPLLRLRELLRLL